MGPRRGERHVVDAEILIALSKLAISGNIEGAEVEANENATDEIKAKRVRK